MIQTILIIALLFIAGSIIYYRSLGFLPFLFGVLIGAAVSIAKVVLLERAVKKISAMEQQQAKNHIVAQQMGSLVLTAAALLLGALIPQISLWGTAAGILSFHPAIYVANYKVSKAKDGKSETGNKKSAEAKTGEPETDQIIADNLRTTEAKADNTESGESAIDC